MNINKEITYEMINNLIRERKDQLEEASKYDDLANREWRLLRVIEDNLWKLTKLKT